MNIRDPGLCLVRASVIASVVMVIAAISVEVRILLKRAHAQELAQHMTNLPIAATTNVIHQVKNSPDMLYSIDTNGLLNFSGYRDALMNLVQSEASKAYEAGYIDGMNTGYGIGSHKITNISQVDYRVSLSNYLLKIK